MWGGLPDPSVYEMPDALVDEKTAGVIFVEEQRVSFELGEDGTPVAVVTEVLRLVDELRITAASGKHIDGAPQAWTEKGPLVEVSVASAQEGGVLVVKRESKLTAGTLPRAELAKIERVLDRRSAALNANVVTIR